MAGRQRSESTGLVDEIDALLPQTQCTKCGYAGCRPYAEAIVRREAGIDQCPPGGADGIVKLAALLLQPVRPLNPRFGAEQPRTAALIREELCIGCTLCIQACPVDAIVGAPKQMHTVLLAVCTGCELCVPPCPVGCIDIIPLRDLAHRGADALTSEATIPVADHARLWRQRYDSRQRRMASEEERRDLQRAEKAAKPAIDERDRARKRAVIQAALERARARRGA
jgi:Na+-translocating ferredoxin:NAD+ oxidoreductase subunit B